MSPHITTNVNIYFDMKYLILALMISFIGTPSDSGMQLFILDEDNNEFLLIQESDIKYYDWEHHEIYINESSYDTILQRIRSGDRFIVKLNGEIIYSGMLDYSYKSEIGIFEPTILCSYEKYPDFFGDRQECYIKIWFFGRGYDKRNSIALFNHLKEKELLKSNFFSPQNSIKGRSSKK